MLTKLLLILILGSCSLVSSKKIVFDTWEGLSSSPAWNLFCDQRNYLNISSHECYNVTNLTIPREDNVFNETVFWSGCYGACLLTYTLRPIDLRFGFQAYFSDTNATVTVVRNGDQSQKQIIAGHKWTNVGVELNSSSTIGIYIPEVTNGSFTSLEKIFLEVEDVAENAAPDSLPSLFASTAIRMPLSPITYTTTTFKSTSIFSLSYFKHLLSRVPLLSTPFVR